MRERESAFGAELAALALGWVHRVLAQPPPWQGPVPEGCITLAEANRAAHQCGYEAGLARVKAAKALRPEGRSV